MKLENTLFCSRAFLFLLSLFVFAGQGIDHGLTSEFNRPWLQKNQALVLDAYELNPIDWNTLSKNKRIVGFINKASDGLPPTYDCRKGKSKLARRLCREQFRKYAITKELFRARKMIAKQKGIKWGAYHMGRPGDPIDQANHFINFAEPGPDDLIALDIEHNDPEKWISLKDAEIFARHIKTRLGRYPLLYLNGNTAKFIARNAHDYPVLSQLGLWYARYKPNIKGVFPMGNWKTYSIWQFSYSGNCNKKRCPYRVKGTKNNIDVNVTRYSIRGLKKKWPLTMTRLPKTAKDSKAATIVAKVDEKPFKNTPSYDAVDRMITGSIDKTEGPTPIASPPIWHQVNLDSQQENTALCDHFGQRVCRSSGASWYQSNLFGDMSSITNP